MAVTDILTDPELKQLRDQYDPFKAGQAMGGGLVADYPPVGDLIGSIGRTLYPEMQNPPKTGPLAPADRERCVLAVLGARQENLNLAVHVYLALCYDVSPGESAHILVLAGVYGGLGSFAHSLDVEKQTLTELKGMIPNAADPITVLKKLKLVFTR